MGRRGGLAARFQSLDAYAKTMDDFSIKTRSGGILTVLTALIIAVLVGNEFAAYRKVEMLPELVVDKERMEKMQINLDIGFPRAPCVLLGLDIMDSSGEQQINLFQHVTKTRLSKTGDELGLDSSAAFDASKVVPPPETGPDGKPYCGSCYGGVPPASGCCNTCSEVHQAYIERGWGFTDPDSIEQCVREGYAKHMKEQQGEGCRMRGFIEINKVAGNFHILAGETIKRGGEHSHSRYDYMPTDFDFSHTIHRLSFGKEFHSQSNPLDGVSKTAKALATQYQYFTKIVGSEVRYRNGTVLKSNQYSATEFTKGDSVEGLRRVSPGVFFMFEISPMRVVYTEHARSLGSFLTAVCAIIGGIFTVARLVDGFVFKTERAMQRKHELGKLN
ncbi:ER-derived vesicles protein erv46 [Linderina macrospora]|uniref:ER-derived vesicles protein erv46 n=1 Tax=Linderina macrospora TaxID=4868 RepID=A0ACC1J2U4_9FUNG|nr:ER-derived vesicles protein erv46 [Linderina macrospora]